ncbi:MAG: transposase family protein [Bacteroidetes bacterium]|nr:transposase family protein [Bacteroidota bacterium]
MNIDKILEKETQLLSVTGLYLSEFEELYRVFKPRWEQKFKHFDTRGKRRKSPLTARQLAKDTQALHGSKMKLFFILNHFKVNAIQQNEAAMYGLDQGQISRWIKLLSPVLHQAIIDLHLQAARTSDEMIRLFRNRQHQDSLVDKPSTTTLNVDGTDRLLSRSVDYEAQKHDFSGKHKVHTIKNTVICDELQFIHFLGYTWRGAIHDKTMLENEFPDFGHKVFLDQWLLKDTGYQGYVPQGVDSIQPYKKKKGQELAEWQKEFNTWVSSLRAVVENAIGGMKRLRALVDKTRGFRLEKFDQVIEIATGLHNLRVTRRQTTYARAIDRVRANLQIQLT